MSEDYLLLKWGTVKGWNFEDVECEAFQSLKKYMKKSNLSAMLDHPDKDRKLILCEVIDSMDGEIQNDWTGEIMTKEDAKKYVMTYGEKPLENENKQAEGL